MENWFRSNLSIDFVHFFSIAIFIVDIFIVSFKIYCLIFPHSLRFRCCAFVGMNSVYLDKTCGCVCVC